MHAGGEPGERPWAARRVRGHVLATAAILALAVFDTSRVAVGQFGGDDEADVTTVATRLGTAVRHLPSLHAIGRIARLISTQDQPPARYVLATPGVLLFPRHEIGTRLVACLLSVLMTYLVIQLGREIGGNLVGYGSGLLIASSAVFNWTSMSFAWSLIVVALVQAIRLLRVATFDLSSAAERRLAQKVNLWIVPAFLTNTSCLLFVLATAGIYAYHNRERRGTYLRIFVPAGAFYALYYLYFLVIVPAVTTGAGQLHHNEMRWALLGFHPHSFLEDLQGLDAYFLPIVGCALLAAALAGTYRRDRRILLWIAPFMLLWSFVSPNSPQEYFLLPTIAIVPYAVDLVASRASRTVTIGLVGVAAAAFAGWSYALFIRTYDEVDFPYSVLRSSLIRADRFHNLVQPYSRIGRDVARLLRPGGTYTHDVSGSLAEFYLNPDLSNYQDPRFVLTRVPQFPHVFDARRGCYRITTPPALHVRVAITEWPLCYPSIRYAGSRIRLYVLPRTARS